jgi:uncharacterized repeat protein (TIGR01451 family)
MKKIILSILFVAALMFVSKANAGSSNCQIVYGGGEVCEEQIKFTINKLVQKPGKGGGDFVENLTLNDPRYVANQNVNFKIIIENTGNRDIENLNVVDKFPDFLTFVAGPGTAKEGDKTASFIVGKLEKGKKIELLITAKTAQDGQLPSSQAVTCVTNNVKATGQDGSVAEDNSQVCIEKSVLGAVPTTQILEKPQLKQIPATGPELTALFALIPTGLAGIYLRKKAS